MRLNYKQLKLQQERSVSTNRLPVCLSLSKFQQADTKDRLAKGYFLQSE